MAMTVSYSVVPRKNPAKKSIEYAPQYVAKYNPDMCEALGLTPPAGYEPISAE